MRYSRGPRPKGANIRRLKENKKEKKYTNKTRYAIIYMYIFIYESKNKEKIRLSLGIGFKFKHPARQRGAFTR